MFQNIYCHIIFLLWLTWLFGRLWKQRESIPTLKMQKQNVRVAGRVAIDTCIWPLGMVCFRFEAERAKPTASFNTRETS